MNKVRYKNKVDSSRVVMNAAVKTVIYLTTIESTPQRLTCVHINRKVFIFSVTATTFSSPNVNTLCLRSMSNGCVKRDQVSSFKDVQSVPQKRRKDRLSTGSRYNYICGNCDVLRVPLPNQPTVQADGVQIASSHSKTQAHAID